jgi:hypothetical protein
LKQYSNMPGISSGILIEKRIKGELGQLSLTLSIYCCKINRV